MCEVIIRCQEVGCNDIKEPNLTTDCTYIQIILYDFLRVITGEKDFA